MEITTELRREILDVIGDTASVFTTVVAKLYVNDGKSTDWTDTGLAGVLCVVYDRVLSAFLFRMYEPNTKDLLFEFELYYEFGKTFDSYGKFFHLFPIPGGVLGIYIPDIDTSQEFKEVITYFAPKEKTEVQKDEKKKSKNKIVKPIGNFMMGLRNKKQEKVPDFTMSKPYAVKLVSSVAWNSEEKSFNLDKVSKDLKNVLKGIGIGNGKIDLRNKDAAMKVIKALGNFVTFKPQNEDIQEDSFENSSTHNPHQTQNLEIYEHSYQSEQFEDSLKSEQFYISEEIPQEVCEVKEVREVKEVKEVQEVQEVQDLEEEKTRMRSSTSRSMSQYNTQQYLLDYISNPPPEPKKVSQPPNPSSIKTQQAQPKPIRNSVVRRNLQDHLLKEMQMRRAEISKYDLKSEASESDFNSEYSEGI